MNLSFSNTYDIRAQLPLSDGLTRTTNPEVPGDSNSFQGNSADLNANLPSESNDDSDLPPRPESRLDFVPKSTCSTGPPSENQPKAQYFSHKRTPSATLRWTREILKKIRLSTSNSSSTLATNDSVTCPIASAVDSPPISIHDVPSHSTSDFLAEEENSTDVACLSTSFGELYSSISNSSSLSTSSSNALDNISVSLSSSSDFGSCENTDDDSDSELDSLKEVDLGDGLTEDDDEVEHDEYVNAIRGKQFYSSASQESIFETSSSTVTTPSLSTPSLSPSFSLSYSPGVESVSESLHAINSEDPEQTPLQYVIVESRSKYTCLPSPLSHVNPDPDLAHSDTLLPPLQPQRHIYTHRGHSRTALHYRKWFWALREEDWERYAEWVEECRSRQEAYTAMSLSPEITNPQSSDDLAASGAEERDLINIGGWGWKAEDHDLSQLFPSLFSKARETMPNNLEQWSQISGRDGLSEVPMSSNPPPLSIHPRWGDLVHHNLSMSYTSVSACLDTWCMHTDRYLLVGTGLGLWTIRKVLWISELNRMCAAVDQTRFSEGEQTFVAEEGLDPGSSIHSRSDDTASLSDHFEDDDEEEGQVMSSSVVSLTSLVSTTESFNASDSDDSDITLVESDSDSEARIASSSLSAIAAQADAQRNGRSVDFEKTCSSTYGSLDDGDEGDFEEIDLSLGSGSSNSGRLFDCAAGSKEPEPPILLQRLYLSQHSELSTSPDSPILSTSTQSKGKALATSKRESGVYRLSQQEGQPLEKRSWYEQCQLLLSLSDARETMT